MTSLSEEQIKINHLNWKARHMAEQIDALKNPQPSPSWKGKQFIIERYEDWKAFRQTLADHYETTHMREDTYVHTLSPFTNKAEGYPQSKGWYSTCGWHSSHRRDSSKG